MNQYLQRDFEGDLDQLIFQSKHDLVRSLSELEVLNQKINEQQSECDKLYLRSRQDDIVPCEKVSIVKELHEKWRVLLWLKDNRTRAEGDRLKALEKIGALEHQKCHFEEVHKNKA